MANLSRNDVRKKRHDRVRVKVTGTSECPRLSVFRSNKHIFAQVIDDTKGETLASASTLALKLEGSNNTEAAIAVGKEVAKQAQAKNINKVVFDRGGYLYHGRIKALADAAREAGLEF